MIMEKRKTVRDKERYKKRVEKIFYIIFLFLVNSVIMYNIYYNNDAHASGYNKKFLVYVTDAIAS